MIVGLDSASCPTPAQVQAAADAGVSMWSGYLATMSRVGLYSPWPRSAFDIAQECGAPPLAFCSGWDSPGACKAQAASWGVRLCLDVEGGIRPDGPWVPGWLAASGAGLYGNPSVHVGRAAAFHVLAAYPGSADVRATWSGPRPAGPCGWQWAGTHPEFGIGVDRGDYDDYFLGEDMSKIDDIYSAVVTGKTVAGSSTQLLGLAKAADVAALTAVVGQLRDALPASGGAMTPAQDKKLSDALAILTRIENGLKAA